MSENTYAQFQFLVFNLFIHSKHHPFTLILRSDQSPILTLYVQTHYAFLPRWNQEDPSTGPSLSRRVPAITCRDLRFAIFLGQLYDTFLHSGRVTETRGNLLRQPFDQPAWNHLLTHFIRPNRDPPGGQLAGAIHHLGHRIEGENDENDITIKDNPG